VVIVGAGVAGLHAAKALKKAPIEITIIEEWAIEEDTLRIFCRNGRNR